MPPATSPTTACANPTACWRAARLYGLRSRAFSCFLELAPAQRGCVILKDVLGHTIDEIAVELDLSVPAVKAALHRGRAVLRHLTETPLPAPVQRALSPELVRYASLFNAHDWDGVRAMLADDVKLDLVSRRKAAGRREVGVYFNNYDRALDWHLTPAWVDEREVLAVSRQTADGQPGYFIELGWCDGSVVSIRDFRYVPYIAQDGLIEQADR